ncbi:MULTISPECIES: hypothetical protein [Streptomyces]|uniref:Membrane protein YndG n=1 Tax=Streptomyces spororaveus TaxID=284039 RepID=A0ABQ3TBC6_9ACTN|nr:hypothetical protein [Streptomyces spororaveus]MCM9081898.1 hypothetical protein [Streptomyces spororaveus]GHI77683.1 hypothetical protein Sspor_32440 [Streptomyces spororaveus]
MGLYVETRIRAGMEELWDRSQDPAQHQRWDLRFTSIDYLPRAEGEPQRFRYATRVLPFLSVDGTGISAGERRRADGTRVSALRFASQHPLSLLAEGSGYWRYVPGPDGIRFLTGYDYRPRWGRFGALADRLVFRPLMGWATAWSFDRLRLWCERGTTPGRALARAAGESALRVLLSVAALLYAPLPAALFVLAAALLLPPLPGTPAARRCLRTPPGRTPVSAPRLLSTLEPS